MLVWIAGAALFLAALPAGLCLLNLFLFRVPRARAGVSSWPVSVLIPARDEEARIGKTLDAVLADPNPQLELVVMDDHSTDRTAELVRERAARDPRARLEVAPRLARGGTGSSTPARRSREWRRTTCSSSSTPT